jgi:tetratricopeptide (TPR) repeat protein
MESVFIVRPFGKRTIYQKGKGGAKVLSLEYDFDQVEKALIRPAMNALGLQGGTTGEVFEAGDIREDMFSALLLSDIVIADISIYNPNVFYELGIRHALRDKITILIKCRGFDETPFDIIGYRYLSYPKEDPFSSLQELIAMIGESRRANRKDSPVFKVLPNLEAQDPEKYMAVPPGFTQETIIAAESGSLGKLALLADEAESFAWKNPALRQIGEALYKAKAYSLAKMQWEKILEVKPDDPEANDLLATIYQRLAEKEIAGNPIEAEALFTKSDLAIEKLLHLPGLSSAKRAEAFALRARNLKTRWLNAWKNLDQPARCTEALQSPLLNEAIICYQNGFKEDLNHFYSGLNALGLLLTRIHLAEQNPATWVLAFSNQQAADLAISQSKEIATSLRGTLRSAIDAAKYRLQAIGGVDPWVNVSEADLFFLNSDQPQRVAYQYKQVAGSKSGLNSEAIVRQLMLYQALGFKTDNVKAALEVMTAPIADAPAHTLLFTGHMIDRKDRAKPRFPAEKESLANEWIREKIIEIKNELDPDTQIIGIAGGASGGDILFHELCQELGIGSLMYLALPREQFLAESVAFAGNGWINRFDSLMAKLPHPVLGESKALPGWLHGKPDYNIWVRNNQWLLNSALVCGGRHLSLISLWNGEGGDGPGGTEHMVREAAKLGAKNYIIDSNKLIIQS